MTRREPQREAGLCGDGQRRPSSGRGRRQMAVRRSGTVLIWVTVFLFALLAFAALVVDGGLALITRRQLQTAASVAALEGVRRPASMTDAEHRQSVVDVVDQLYDDSLHAQGEVEPPDDVEFGAGPVWNHVDGTALPGTTYRAGPHIELATPRFFRPHLATNAASNELAGDLVRGNYDRNQASHQEAKDYSRSDFTADENGSACLIHVRRTGESFVGDVGSTGPRVPYLFGRAPAGNTAAWYDERDRGMAIRGAAIADLERVTIAGPRYPRSLYQHLGTFSSDQDLEGLGPWSVRLEEWNAGEVRVDVADLSTTELVRLIGATRLNGAINAADTQLTVAAASGFPGSGSVPFVIRVDDELMEVTQITGGTTWTVTRAHRQTQSAAHADGAIVSRMDMMTIGESLAVGATDGWRADPTGTTPADGSGFVAVHATRAAFGERVVGFSRASWRVEMDELIITPGSNQTAARSVNASAHFPRRLPLGVTSDNLTDLLTAHRELNQSLRAPILVRAIE
jgi:hypothetical protein